jgi:hypothetical protein
MAVSLMHNLSNFPFADNINVNFEPSTSSEKEWNPDRIRCPTGFFSLISMTGNKRVE